MRSNVGPGRALGLLGVFLAVSLVSGALIAGLFLPAVGATGNITRASVDYFNSIPAEIKDAPLSEQSVMLANDGKTVLARFYEENRSIVPLSKISPAMQDAITSIEDSRFREHGGVDLQGLGRAALSNWLNEGDRVQGASTVTQQYVKNILVEAAVARGDKEGAKAAVDKNNARKLREIRMALQLEKRLTKDQILEGYLNIANFGDATYGVEAAAQYYFSTKASKLTIPQAATLAGLVQEPGYYSPVRHQKRALERRNVVLKRMLDTGRIQAPQYQKAVTAKLGLKPKVSSAGCIAARDNMAFFCSYVRRMIEIDPRFEALGKTEAERKNAINRGGYTIVTTIDPKLQKAAFKAVTKRIPVGDKSGVASAAVTVEAGTGKVLAMAQNKIYSPKESVLGRTEINYGVDSQYGGSVGFQTGSTFKPFTLATWLRKGNSTGDMVDASKTSRPYSDFKSCGQRLGSLQPYEFSNSEGSAKGSMTVLNATKLSVNTAYVDIESRLDLCDIVDTAEKIGVHTAAPYGNDCSGKIKSTTRLPTCNPSLTLGPREISPVTMASAYAAFAANGTYCPPNPLVSIKDRAGKSVSFKVPECKKDALDEDVARGVTHTLKNVWRGTASRVPPIRWPSAGKTGTTDRSMDTWFVGYTAQRSTAVWVGDPTIRKTKRCPNGCRKVLPRRTIGGQYYGNVYGATLAAPIWRDVMVVAQKGLPRVDWQRPPLSMTKGSGVRVPDVRGRPIAEAFSILRNAGFEVTLGRPVDSKYPAGFIAETSPSGGQVIASGGSIIIYPSTGRGGGDDDDERPGGPGGPPDRD